MALLRRNIWLVYYLLLIVSLSLLIGLSVNHWHSAEESYQQRQNMLVEQWYGSIRTLLVQQETIMDVLGRQVASLSDPQQMTQIFRRLLAINPDFFSGFALSRPDGTAIAMSSELSPSVVNSLNLSEMDVSKDSFLYSLTQDKMVLGRVYRFATDRVILPMRKAIRNDRGEVEAVMSGSFRLPSLKQIFSCDNTLPECAEITVVRSRDRYPLYIGPAVKQDDFYTTPFDERQYQRLMSALGWKSERGYDPYSNLPVSYRRSAGGHHYKIGSAIYNPRYEFWLLLEVDETVISHQLLLDITGYFIVFLIFQLCLYLLFRIIHTSEEKRRAELFYQANHDILTALPNRNNLQQLFDCWRNPPEWPLAIQFIDMNNFKGVNDSFGHACGDRVLKDIAGRIKNRLDNQDQAFRLGGDEFIVITRYDHDRMLLNNAALLMSSITDIYSIDGHNFMLGASMGIARFPQDGRTLDQLLRSADVAMYEAKRHKRPLCLFEDRMQDSYLRRIVIEQQLRGALLNNEVFMMYQPQVDTAGNFYGIECLVRWENKTLGGLVPPDQFIPVAEQSGLMPALGDFIIDRSLQEIAVLQQAFDHEFHVSVNISVRQFLHEGFLPALLTEIKRSGINHMVIALEITESIFIEDMDHIIFLINSIHEKGIRISMDDFGTGYSSLSLLHQLPVDEIKIDKSFVDHILDKEGARKMIQSIIAIGKNHHMSLVAEGVENAEQAALLTKYGCDRFQGYHYSRPLTVDGLKNYLCDKHAF